MIFIKIFYAVIMIAGGAAILKYRKSIKGMTGNFYWAEKYIGNGGTYVVIIFMALFLIFAGVLYPFGGLELLFGTQKEAL